MSIDPDQKTLETAAAWFMKARSGPLSGAQRRRLHAWLSQDLRHAVALDQIERAWRETEVLTGSAISAASAAASPGRRATRRRVQPQGRGPKRRVSQIAIGVAASVGALCLAVGVAYRPIAYSAPLDAPLDVTLADGSRMSLSPGSEATMRWTPLSRRMSLEKGRATYVVAHGERRPFVVDDGRISVKATGTRFVVEHHPERTMVFLAEGGVVLIDPRSDAVRARMVPGDRVWISGQGSLRFTSDGSISSETIEFDDLPLRQALSRFTQATTTRISVASELDAIRVSGVYRKADLEIFLNSLSTVEPITWRRVDDDHLVVEARTMP